VKDYRIIVRRSDGSETILADVRDNHLRNRRHDHRIDGVTALRLECLSTHGVERAQVYAIRVFAAL
jgi:hypothetical protein